jgi:hypothetical protein
LVCDVLYNTLLYWDSFICKNTTYFGAWGQMMNLMHIEYLPEIYQEYDCLPHYMIIPDFSKHPIFSPFNFSLYE